MADQKHLVEKDEGDVLPEDPRGLEQFISQDSLYRLEQRALLEAELFHRTRQLKHFGCVREALRKEPDKAEEIRAQLRARADDLRQQLSGFRALEPAEPMPIARHLDGFDDVTRPHLSSSREIVFASTGTVPFPKAKNFSSVRPEAPGTSGFIKVMGREANGTIHFDGTIKATAPSDPTTLHSWLRGWKYVIPFPPPLSKSILTYRFSILVEAWLFAEVSEGTVMVFASVGEDSNFTPAETIDVKHDVGWPLVGDLTEPTSTYNGRYGRMLGALPVERAFGVGGGKTPAVAIVVGAVGSIASGECAFQFGQYCHIFPSSSGIIGVLDYRYDPVEIADP